MRPGLEVQLTKAQAVSIHASVKDATWSFKKLHQQHKVSIHASVKDATSDWLPSPGGIAVSIHASVKDATIALSVERNRWKVSIHASVKDATCCSKRGESSCSCFNPRICKRCDVFLSASTLSSGGFNPRICKRCDKTIISLFTIKNVSIHASVKDATML